MRERERERVRERERERERESNSRFCGCIALKCIQCTKPLLVAVETGQVYVHVHACMRESVVNNLLSVHLLAAECIMHNHCCIVPIL